MNVPLETLVVGDFMSIDPVTASEELSIVDAQDRMTFNEIRHLLVVRNGQLTGIVSAHDLGRVWSTDHRARCDLTVRDAMTARPYCCTPTTRVSEVARVLERNRYGCAVVIDGDDVVGIFTTIDALRILRSLALGEHPQPKNPPASERHASKASIVVQPMLRFGPGVKTRGRVSRA
ncbi:MAG: CBS domain-containing protein [Myxococcota bacterium]